jgi:hypothetical protein
MRHVAIGLLIALVLSRGLAAATLTDPCKLKSPCKLIEPLEFLDVIGSGAVKLIDHDGSGLVFAYFEGKAYFVSGTKSKVDSTPGSPQEQCLLKILKESLAGVYNPAFDKDPGGAASKRFFEQHAVKHLIRVLESRCAAKS